MPRVHGIDLVPRRGRRSSSSAAARSILFSGGGAAAAAASSSSVGGGFTKNDDIVVHAFKEPFRAVFTAIVLMAAQPLGPLKVIFTR